MNNYDTFKGDPSYKKEISQLDRYSILHVDSSLDFREIFSCTFRQWFDITSAGTEEEALDLLRTKIFDAVVVDYDPRNVNGLDLIRPIKLIRSDMPVIILTGHGDENTARDSFIRGACDYFSKDLTEYIQREKLLSCIRRAIDMKNMNHDRRHIEEVYRALVEGVGQPIFAVDRKGGISFLNQAAVCKLKGIHHPAPGESRDELVFQSGSGISMDIIRQVIETGEPCVAGFETTDESTTRFYEARIQPRKNPDGTIDSAIAIAFDVTAHRQTQQALRESEQRLRSLAEAASEGIIIHRDWVVVDVNDALCNLFGYERNQLIGQSVSLLTREKAHQQLIDLSHSRCSTPVVIQGIRKDHSSFSCEVACRPYSYRGEPLHVATFRDITDRLWAEDARRKSEMNFRAVFETARDSIFIKDENLRYTHVNSAMEKLYGIPACELIGRTDQELFGDQEKEASLVDKRVLSGQVVREENAKCINGVTLTFNTIKVPLRDDEGNIFGLCGIARDVTERKRMEQELINRNRELSDFSYRVSHDLKSPLNILKGYLLALEEEPEKQALFLPRLRKQANRITEFIDRLLSLSRAGKVLRDKKKVPIKPLVENCILKTAGDAPILFTTDFQFDSVDGDIESLMLVFTNLFENSIKYCNPRREKVEISVKGRKTGSDILIEVKDNGIGIKSEELDNIFLPGYALKKDRSTGFGLAIVKKIIEAHGGSISARSDGPDKGTSFIIRFPLID